MLLFDTTFVIDLEREFGGTRPGKAAAFLDRYRDAVPNISIITY
jgi:hypothetical protein